MMSAGGGPYDHQRHERLDVDFWLDRSAGIRKRKKAFRTKSEAERWVIDLKRQYSLRGRDPGERLADLVSVWHELHGCTLKDKYRLPRTLAVVELLGNTIASGFTALDFSRFRMERLKTCTASTVTHPVSELTSCVTPSLATTWSRAGTSWRCRKSLGIAISR